MFDENNTELARKTTKYDYDSNGNQLKKNISYILPNNISLRPATTGAAYGDNVSEEISMLVERTNNTYDGFNRLKKAERIKSGVRTLAEYTYDGDDLRTRKTVKKSDSNYNAEVTNYIFDRQHVILETDASDSVKVRYIKGINYIARIASNKLSYLMYNGHGDVVQTVSESGEVENNYDYDIWGNPTLAIEQYSCAIRYAGEFYDAETGLYYLRARYYDPYIGRFISEDSYWGEDENPLSLNLYTYAENDPIQYTDPTGHVRMYNSAGIPTEVAEDEVSSAQQVGFTLTSPDPNGEYYYEDENGKGHVRKIEINGKSGLISNLIYDKILLGDDANLTIDSDTEVTMIDINDNNYVRVKNQESLTPLLPENTVAWFWIIMEK